MLEIIALIFLTNSIGKIVRAKGLKATEYQLTAIALWFGFEIFGFIAGFFVFGILLGDAQFAQCSMYLLALGGAALGGWTGYDRAKKALPATGLYDEFAASRAANQIQALQKQLDAGRISAQEFEEKKAKILAQFR